MQVQFKERHMDSSKDFELRISQLEAQLNALKDAEAIKSLQRIYGYYIDHRMWDEIVDMFVDDGSIEIGRRGLYVGKERILRFMIDVLGSSRSRMIKNELWLHLNLQPVVTINPDGVTASARLQCLIYASLAHAPDLLLNVHGVYEVTYVKKDGKWFIKHLGWVPTFYMPLTGFSKAWFKSAMESGEFPPDMESVPSDHRLGRSFLPFHFVHPITGKEVPLWTTPDDGLTPLD
jgi:hypothetical protein